MTLAVGGVLPLAVGVATPASAATSGVYLQNATDPHGNVWLPGTTDGTKTGPMDPGTDPSSASYGHLWTTDVPSGFCRILPSTTDTTTGAVTAAVLDRTTVGGCIVAGGKVGGPALDPRRNADGTFYVYGPDWAARSLGVYRMTYDPGTQTMIRSELLAPNRFPLGIKPFDVQMGADNKLYVSDDLDGNLYRITDVNGPLGLQTVETVGKSSDASRMRALTFACWSNLGLLNGGLGASRAAGAPGCSAGDPAPDLVLAQKTSITVILNAETCQATLAGCTAVSTPIKVLTPMGLRTDPADPSVLYVSDSPGTLSQIIRYTIGTNIQDSYANYGLMPDGSLTQFSFAFDVGFGPDHSMYVGDDPTAGATAFNGRYFSVGPNAPADALGTPGVPANIPPMPTPFNGTLYGGAFGLDTAPAGYTDPTLPGNSVWLPGFLGGHLWTSDSINGLCRMDVPPGGTLTHENVSTCVVGATAAGLLKPEQSSFDAGRNLLYVADGSSKSVGVVRFSFDPVAETLSNPQVIAAGLVGTGLGLDGQRADAVARDPLTDELYVGFRTRKVGTGTQIARVPDASAADTTTQAVQFVAKTTRDVPVFGLGVIVNPAANGFPATEDLYVGDNKGVDTLFNVHACAPGACSSLLMLNVRGPKGFATDGTDHLWLSSPPPPGTASSTTTVQQYTISAGQLAPFTAIGVSPDGTQNPYSYVFGLTLDPAGNVYVSDNPGAVAPPNNVAHVWKVNRAATGPAQPTLTSKPVTPSNNASPVFGFQSGTAGVSYQCSLVGTTTPSTADVFTACISGQTFGPLADGPWTFKVQAVDADGVISAATTYGFTVDTVLPVITITSPPNPTNLNTPTFSFTSSKPSTAFTCSLSTGAPVYTACGSPQTYIAQPDGAYTFSVQGVDLAGNISGATIGVPIAAATAPGAPTIGAATAGDASATVNWTAPANNGGSVVTGYSVKVVDAAGAQVGLLQSAGAGATSLLVTGLTNGTAVNLQVQAINAVGGGAFSGLSAAVTPAAAPGAPTIGVATRGNASALVHWTAPANNGGSVVTGYSVKVVNAAGTQVGLLRPAVGTATSLLVSGLANGTAVRFQVRAINAVGGGAFSGLSAAVTPAAVPGAPVIGLASSGVAGGRVNAVARWAAPRSNGGAAVNAYVVTALRMSATGAVLGRTVSGAQPAGNRAVTMTLAAGKYRFVVRARNAVGLSSLSARSNLVTAR